MGSFLVHAENEDYWTFVNSPAYTAILNRDDAFGDDLELDVSESEAWAYVMLRRDWKRVDDVVAILCKTLQMFQGCRNNIAQYLISPADVRCQGR